MASYGYGYGSFTSQPQQYTAASYGSQSTGSYGYGTTQPVSRVVQGFQQTGNTGYYTAPAQAPIPAAATSGGYGYFQRASDPSAAYVTTQKPNYSSTQGYQKPQQGYGTSQVTSSYSSGFSTAQQRTNNTPSYNNSFQKAKRQHHKTQQLHYCDVCKISCGGSQTYKEHLEGQKHKKKAASQTADTKNLAPGTYKCELCEVICTGKDAFLAHIKGAAHMKTLKLHQKLGKPIPDIKVPEESKSANVVKTTAPRMNFVGGTKLTMGGEEKTTTSEDSSNQQEIPQEGEPIGEEYVEEVKSDAGKVISFKCTICDCRFNDNVAKSAHIKGRRHRLSYKKKVDPSLKVEGGNRGLSRGSRGSRGSQSRDEIVWKQRQQEQMRWERQLRMREEELRRWEHEEYMRRANEDRYWTRPDRNRMHELEYYEWERREKFLEPQSLFAPPQGPPPTPDDKLVMAKHTEIYPTEPELKQVQTIVAAAEKALKLVSDEIGDGSSKPEEGKLKEEKPAEQAETEQTKTEKGKKEQSKNEQGKGDQSNRVLKGIMRVGALAKGLLLKNQSTVELVIICAEKTTYTLLRRVGKLVPEKLAEAVPNEKYNMQISTVDGAIIMSTTTEPKCSVKIYLTSPAMRDEEAEVKKEDAPVIKKELPVVVVDPKDVMDKGKAQQSLAALRHAKWFQARANQLQSCVITIRLFRDLCSRVPAFKPLKDWPIELLCEKSLGSSFQPLPPGEAFRRVLEAIASGIFLPGGPGLMDPCEKDKTDAAAYLTSQEREDITAAAQHALRLTAFRQLHKVLGVEPLKAKRKRPNPNQAAVGDTLPKLMKVDT